MLKVLCLPFYILKAIWNLLPILASALYHFAVGAQRVAEELEKCAEIAERASQDLLERERARNEAKACEYAYAQRVARKRVIAALIAENELAGTSPSLVGPHNTAHPPASSAARDATPSTDAPEVAGHQQPPNLANDIRPSQRNQSTAEFIPLVVPTTENAVSRPTELDAPALVAVGASAPPPEDSTQPQRWNAARIAASTAETAAGKVLDSVKLPVPSRSGAPSSPPIVSTPLTATGAPTTGLIRTPAAALVASPHAAWHLGDQTVPVHAPQLAQAPPSPKTTSTTVPLDIAPLQLILLDLDGTLLRTADLERFRGRAHLGPQSAEYFDALTEAFHQDASRWIYRPKPLADLIAACPGVKFGVFTRSPSAYATHLLELGFPDVRWDVVVAFEDVRRTKPHGDGVRLAMRLTGISDLARVVLVGDDTSDIQAAYSAGCLAFLETRGWTEPNRLALEKIPDAKVMGPQSLLHAVQSLAERLPALESAMLTQSFKRHSNRFDAVAHLGPEGKKLVVHVAGRLFVDSPELAARRLFHLVTQSILDNKNSTDFPDFWISVLISFLQTQLNRHDPIVVTIIPAKSGRAPRLEHLLAQLEHQSPAGLRKRCRFIPDLLNFGEAASSHSGQHLRKQERMANARANLFINRPESVMDHDIVVIDDVVTSGATLLAAEAKLIESGARSVTCAALAKAEPPRLPRRPVGLSQAATSAA